MFGYASDETEFLMPAPIYYSHRLVEKQTELLRSKKVSWLRPDAKSQVTFQYENDKPKFIDTVVLSTQHSSDISLEELFEELGKPVRTIPQIVIDKTHIGGFNELREYFIDKGRINFRGELLDINDFEL